MVSMRSLYEADFTVLLDIVLGLGYLSDTFLKSNEVSSGDRRNAS